MDLDTARAALRRRPLAPFHPWRWPRTDGAVIREADNNLNNGWVRHADRAVIHLAAPYAWDEEGIADVARDEMHRWEMLDALAVAHGSAGAWQYLETAIELIDDWATYGAQATEAWQPRSTAHRAHLLGYVTHAGAIADSLDPAGFRSLAKLARRHAERLAAMEAGAIEMPFVAAGLESLSRRIGLALDIDGPPERTLLTAVAGAVDADGAYLARAPSLHIALATMLAASDLDSPDAGLVALRRPIERALAWLISTDGTPANFETTSLEPVSPLWFKADASVHAITSPLADDLLRHAVSAGAAGKPPTHDTMLLEGAALLVGKPIWPENRHMTGPYLAMDRTTGDLVWHDCGRPLLVEPGTTAMSLRHARGPMVEAAREWLETSSAHNRLSAGPPVPAEAETAGRVGVINGTTFFDVTRHHGDTSRRRSVVINPGRWLFVADRLTRAEAASQPALQHFLLAPGLDVVLEGDHYLVAAEGVPVMWAAAIHDGPRPIAPRRGGQHAAGGWWAPRPGRVAPATSIGWTAEGRQILVASVFSFGGPITPRDTETEGSFAFESGDRTTRMVFSEWGLVEMQEAPI